MKQNNLKTLQARWYKKLKDSGFKDIEDDVGRLKTWSGHAINLNFNEPLAPTRVYSSKVWKVSQAEYYRLAAQFLYNNEFPSDHFYPSEWYEYIWSLHVEGLTGVDIGKRLGMSKRAVTYRIRKMRKKFFSSE